MPDPLSLIDHDTDGRRADVTPLFADPAAFREVVRQIVAMARPTGFTVVAGIDALGFVLGAAVALEAGTGFVPVRKGGKLPVATDPVSFDDYDGTLKTLEVRRDAFRAADRVLIVDEWIETGAQVLAAATLIEGRGGTVAGAATLHCDDGGIEAVGSRFPLLALERD